jgi:hypothetical protein
MKTNQLITKNVRHSTHNFVFQRASLYFLLTINLKKLYVSIFAHGDTLYKYIVNTMDCDT